MHQTFMEYNDTYTSINPRLLFVVDDNPELASDEDYKIALEKIKKIRDDIGGIRESNKIDNYDALIARINSLEIICKIYALSKKEYEHIKNNGLYTSLDRWGYRELRKEIEEIVVQD